MRSVSILQKLFCLAFLHLSFNIKIEKADDKMQIIIQSYDGFDEPFFTMSNGSTTIKIGSLPDPAVYPVVGYPKLQLLDQLKWYLEDFLEYPIGANKEKGEAIVSTLKAWGMETFNRLFTGETYKWYIDAQLKLDTFQIIIISNSSTVLSWPWEALCSSDIGYLAQHCLIERRSSDITMSDSTSKQENDELHILFVIARPYGNSDVGYHALVREIVDYITREHLSVKIDVMRPPTFDNLKRTLEVRPNYYHIVHFDGHGGFGPHLQLIEGNLKQVVEGILIFENDAGKEYVVGAERLGQILSQHRVPMVILNACRSAMMIENTMNPFASVATSLLKAGIHSVVAMGYNLYVNGAKHFVPAFYARLLQDGTLGGAMRAGRQAMFRNSNRTWMLGECPLQDWIVPQLYQQAQVREWDLPILYSACTNSGKESNLPDDVQNIGTYGFIGRGEAIHELERILQQKKQAGILIYGMIGVGKTTLTKGFLIWLQNTGGLRDNKGNLCPVFWFDFRFIFSAEHIINTLVEYLLEVESQSIQEGEKYNKLVQYLIANRVFIVWDHFETASGIQETEMASNLSDRDRRQLKALLQKLWGGKTRILITSLTQENWLSEEECVRVQRPLDGLQGEDLWIYCNAVVNDLGVIIDQEDESFKELLRKLDGNPLTIRAIFSHLQECSASELSCEMLNDADGDESTLRILDSFYLVCRGMDAKMTQVLQILGLHEYYADAGWIESILLNIEQIRDPNSLEAQIIWELITRCFSLLENVGLCENVGKYLYHLHPALRGCLSKNYPSEERVQYWFACIIGYMGQQVLENNERFDILSAIHNVNFYHAKEIAENLGMQYEDLQVTYFLAEIANSTTNFAQAEHLYRELVEKAHQYGNADIESRAYISLAVLANRRGDEESAKVWVHMVASIWEKKDTISLDALYGLGYNAMRFGNLSSASTYFEEALAISSPKDAVLLYNRLGEIAEKQKDDENAKKWYQKGWQLAKDCGDKLRQAILSNSLGKLTFRQGKISDAETWFLQALEIFTELREFFHVACTCNSLGELYAKKDIYPVSPKYILKAKKYLLQSLQIAQILNMESLILLNYDLLGLVSVKEYDTTSARTWWEQALLICEKLGDKANAAKARAKLSLLTDLESNP